MYLRFCIVLVFAAFFFAASLHAEELQCQSLNDTIPNFHKLMKCGYSHTARFNDSNLFTLQLHNLLLFKRVITNCSALTDLMGCSLFVPRCTEEIKGPYLPCRGVCHDWVNACKDAIRASVTFEWTAGICDILPEKDDPQTTKGYRGRCFVPPGYKRSGQIYTHNCSEIMVPACRGIPGFTHSILSQSTQLARRKYLESALNASYLGNDQCAPLLKELTCAAYLRPCVENGDALLCQDKCLKTHNACHSSFPTRKEACEELPKRGEDTSLDSAICKVKHWPLSSNWHLPDDEMAPSVTPSLGRSKSSTNGSAEQTSPGPTESNKRGSVRASAGKKLSSGSIVGIVLGLLAGLLIIVVLVFLFRRYKNSRSLSKPVLVVDEEKDDL